MLSVNTSTLDGILQHFTGLNWAGLFFQFFIGYIPQGFAILLFVHVIMRQRIKGKEFLYSGALMSLAIFVVRIILPINFGVHTILNILILIGIACGIHKFPLVRTCISAFLVMIFLYLLEAINFFITLMIFGQDYIVKLKANIHDPIQSAPGWMPPSIEFVIIVLIAYLIFSRRKAKRDAKNLQTDRVEN